MDHNNILPVVLAGGKSKRFGDNKPQAILGNKILINYIIQEILKQFKEILVVTNNPINNLFSDKIYITEDFIKM
jgi:Molybdopterin-guanine dinucleotide biosynthesis protein A